MFVLIYNQARAQVLNKYGEQVLENVQNTSNLNKPISNATQTALGLKADLTLSNLSNAAMARTNMGAVIGTDIQAYNIYLADLADGLLSANLVENAITTPGTIGEVWTSDGSGSGTWSVPATTIIQVGSGLVITGSGTVADPYIISLPLGGTIGQALTIGTDGVPAWEDTAAPVNTYYLDADGDGFGDINEPIAAVSMPSGYVTDNTDCDDTDRGLYPSVVWYADVDGDGYGDAGSSETGCTPTLANATHDNTDCNDSDASVNAGETEIPDDGIDNDCDGETDEGEIGQLRGGGIVFYVASTPADLDGDGDLDNGLVAAIADQTKVYWGSNGLTGASGAGIGDGGDNTNLIISANGAGTYAASVARAYRGGGYSDWFLPSTVELRMIYNSLASQGIGNFNILTGSWYMSSTESNSSQMFIVAMNSGRSSVDAKSITAHKIRAVRAF